MLMMLDQNFFAMFVSIFNTLCSRGFEAISFTVTILDNNPMFFDVVYETT